MPSDRLEASPVILSFPIHQSCDIVESMERLLKLMIVLQLFILVTTCFRGCISVAHAAPGIGDSASRMADALERIAKSLELRKELK